MNISELLHSGSKILKLKKIKTHQLDSELVLSNLLKQAKRKFNNNPNQKVSESINS